MLSCLYLLALVVATHLANLSRAHSRAHLLSLALSLPLNMSHLPWNLPSEYELICPYCHHVPS